MIVDLFLKVLNLSISAVPLMAVLLVLRLLFKKAVPRKVFYIAWAFVFMRLMVPFSIESDLSFFNHVPEVSVSEEAIGTSVVFVENENERVEFPVYINPEKENPNVDWVHHSVITGEIVTGPDITTVPMDKNLILSTVWIFGTAALLLFGIIGYFAVLKKLKFESVEYTDKIRLSEFFKTPVVCGLFSPKIILPMNFDLDDEAKVEAVIAHESTHIRRKDNLWRLIATFTLYVHWFNPFVWVCYNAFIRDMEVSCDEEVLSKSKTDIRSEYAESLVSLSGKGTNPLYGGVLSFGECAIKERVKCIMNFKKTTVLIIIICIAAAAALGVIFLTNPSAPSEENQSVSYEVFETENSKAVYSTENGLEIEVSIKNTDKKTIWLGPATYIYSGSRNNGTFVGVYGNGGVLMIPKGEEALFCDTIPSEKFHDSVKYSLPAGKYMLSREVYFDEGLTPTGLYADFSFEIRENNSLETAEDILAFIEKNPDLLGLIENPAAEDMSIDHYRAPMHWEKYKAKNPEIPDAVIKFFYLYHSTFATLEVPDFSYIGNGTGIYDTMEQLLRYQVARERLENSGDYVTDFEITIEKESGDSNEFVYSCLYEYEHKSGRKSGGRDYWEFRLVKNSNSGEYEIKDFEWVQKGHGGLYPGLENIFEDIAQRYYPHHNNDYELIANIGICELLIENGYFGSSSEETPIRDDLSGKIVSGSIAEEYIPSVELPEKQILGDANMADYYRTVLKGICSGTTKLRVGGITFVMQPNDKNYVLPLDKDGAGLLMKMIEKINVMNVEPMPNPNTGGLIEIYLETENGIVKIAYDGRLVLTHQGAEYAYVFDGESISGVFNDIQSLAGNMIAGAEEYVEIEKETNPQPGSDDIGKSENSGDIENGANIIPRDVEYSVRLFDNNEKTSAFTSIVVQEKLLEILKHENFEYLGKTSENQGAIGFYAVPDAVEFIRTEDGKKYQILPYEDGFVIRGSALSEGEQLGVYKATNEKWDEFVEIMQEEYATRAPYLPYWFGLVHEKNATEISVQKNGGELQKFYPEDDCFGNFFASLQNVLIDSINKRFEGNTIRKPDSDEYITVKITFRTGVVYEIVAERDYIAMVSSDMNYGLKYNLYKDTDAYDLFLDFAEEGGPANPATAKPVIYLYSEKETVVSVNLDFDGRLTYTYPALNNGWKVLAKPDGTLTNLADGSTHYYLFWEGNARPKWTYEKGFVVKGCETEAFLRENLAKMGLTPREYNDFITYWVPKMQENPYNLISFSGDEYSEIAKLTVNPKPDSVIRIHMVWKSLDEPIEIEPQVLPVYERKGFTLVEWGGTEIF